MEFEDLLLLTAVEFVDRTVVVAAQEKGVNTNEEPHTVLLVRDPDGEWSEGGAFPQLTVGMCISETGDRAVLVDNNGHVSDYKPVERDQAQMYPPDRYESHQVRFLKNIAGAVYSGGTNRHLHQRDSGRQWIEISTDAMRPNTDDPIGFEDMDGFSADELYAVGWDGAIWARNGPNWSEINSPTNLILTSVVAGSDRLFVGGQLGTILEGRGTDWRPVEHEESDADIWSAAAFGDAIYFATNSVILKWEAGEIGVAHPIDTEVMRTAHDLKVGPSGLWSIGRQDLVLFDGDEWRSVLQT